MATARGLPPVEPRSSSVPTTQKLPDGQYADHWVLSEEDRQQNRVRPLRNSYRHVGIPAPDNPLRDLTEAESARYAEYEYVKFEAYQSTDSAVLGRFWTQAELDAINNGCGAVTRMPALCAETYAVTPSFYGSTFCHGCGQYLPVGEHGEFVWLDDGTRVGT